jgi:hypothetical protein
MVWRPERIVARFPGMKGNAAHVVPINLMLSKQKLQIFCESDLLSYPESLELRSLQEFHVRFTQLLRGCESSDPRSMTLSVLIAADCINVGRAYRD